MTSVAQPRPAGARRLSGAPARWYAAPTRQILARKEPADQAHFTPAGRSRMNLVEITRHQPCCQRHARLQR